MTDANIYNLVSLVAALASIASAFVAIKAMRRGLTYDAMHGMVVVLAFVAIGRVWHTTREFMGYGTWAELVEYVVYIVGNSAFLFLAKRAHQAKGPDASVPANPAA